MTNEEHYEQERDDYESCVRMVREFPTTWVPALLITAIESAHERGILMPGGATSIAAKTEHKIGKAGKLEIERQIIVEREGQVGDLVMLVVRLSRCLPRDSDVRMKALDYLARNKLTPSVLREGQ